MWPSVYEPRRREHVRGLRAIRDSAGDRAVPLEWRHVRTAAGREDYLWGAIDFRGPALLDDLKSGFTIDDFLAGCPTVTREQVEEYLELTQDLAAECVES